MKTGKGKKGKSWVKYSDGDRCGVVTRMQHPRTAFNVASALGFIVQVLYQRLFDWRRR